MFPVSRPLWRRGLEVPGIASLILGVAFESREWFTWAQPAVICARPSSIHRVGSMRRDGCRRINPQPLLEQHQAEKDFVVIVLA